MDDARLSLNDFLEALDVFANVGDAQFTDFGDRMGDRVRKPWLGIRDLFRPDVEPIREVLNELGYVCGVVTYGVLVAVEVPVDEGESMAISKHS